MASNTTTLLNQGHSSGHSIIPTTLHRRKQRNSAIAVALRRRGTHKKYSGISSPVNFRQDFVKNEVSVRKLAAGLWQLRFVEVSGDGRAVIGDEPLCSSKSKVRVCINVMLFFSHNPIMVLNLRLNSLTCRYR